MHYENSFNYIESLKKYIVLKTRCIVCLADWWSNVGDCIVKITKEINTSLKKNLSILNKEALSQNYQNKWIIDIWITACVLHMGIPSLPV